MTGLRISWAKHSYEVALKCMEIAEVLGYGEEVCEEFFMVGLIHDSARLLPGVEQVKHETIAGNIFKRMGLKYSDAIARHDQDVTDEAQMILIMADLTTGPNGERLTLKERLIDISKRYGEGTIQTENSKKVAESLKVFMKTNSKYIKLDYILGDD